LLYKITDGHRVPPPGNLTKGNDLGRPVRQWRWTRGLLVGHTPSERTAQDRQM